MIDYSKSIEEIVEAHLSPTPVSDGRVKVGGDSISGTNRDIDAAIAEAGGIGPSMTRGAAMGRMYGGRKYGRGG